MEDSNHFEYSVSIVVTGSRSAMMSFQWDNFLDEDTITFEGVAPLPTPEDDIENIPRWCADVWGTRYDAPTRSYSGHWEWDHVSTERYFCCAFRCRSYIPSPTSIPT